MPLPRAVCARARERETSVQVCSNNHDILCVCACVCMCVCMSPREVRTGDHRQIEGTSGGHESSEVVWLTATPRADAACACGAVIR